MKYNTNPTIFGSKIGAYMFIGFVLLCSGIILYILPTTEANKAVYDQEEAWLPNADCVELKQYILEAIEDNTHYFKGKAQELYQWKCAT